MFVLASAGCTFCWSDILYLIAFSNIFQTCFFYVFIVFFTLKSMCVDGVVLHVCF